MSDKEQTLEERMMNPPLVKSGFLKCWGQIVYWRNGTGRDHSTFLKLTQSDNNKQDGFEKLTYSLACDEKGNPIFGAKKYTMSDFHKVVDRVMARQYATLIAGLSDEEDGKTDFDKGVDGEVKNSKKASESSTS